MASARVTLSTDKGRRPELYNHYCPTCGTTQLRDGRFGNFNRDHFCDEACFSKYRAQAIPNQYLTANLASAIDLIELPPIVGET